jgi:group I intron endonuclease
MQSGIYIIKCLKNNKILVGQSLNILRRFSQHKFHLKNNKHDNKHLQAAYNKYGYQNFIFSVLILCSEEYLFSEENYWCNLLNTHNPNFGYNIKPTDPNGNYRHSEETKNKISQKLKGYKHSENFKKNCSLRMKGHVKSKATIEKIKISATGKVHTKESKEKMSLAKKNKKIVFSKEHEASIKRGYQKWLSTGVKNKKIIDELSGVIYNSVSECLENLNISTSAFYRNINNKGKMKNKYKLNYVKAIK